MSADFGRLSSLESLEDVSQKKVKDDWALIKQENVKEDETFNDS